MEAKLVDELPHGRAWQFEPKWDGFCCLAFRDDEDVDLRAKSGKPLSRFFPEIVAILSKVPSGQFVLDGELTIPVGDNLSFDALQMRLHPAASRIRKLAQETPATFTLFDCLASAEDGNLMDNTLTQRRRALEDLYGKIKHPSSGCLRNDPTSTAVAPYSTRARPGAPVATPLAWSEVRASLDPAAFNVRKVPTRLKRSATDPWADMGRVKQRLPPAARERRSG